jgi:predicted MPP superfamily phosphohydrolase
MRKISRRTFMKLGGSSMVAAAMPLFSLSSRLGIDSYQLGVERVTVRSARIPAELNGFSIGQLSDLHRGRDISVAYIEKAVRMLQALSPDLIALTGDYVYGAGMGLSAMQALRELSAPQGVFAILGNHDYWEPNEPRSEPEIVRAMREVFAGKPFQLLRNSHTRLTIGDTPLHMVGMEDAMRRQADLKGALRGLAANQPAILLAHEPDVADQAASLYPLALQLSGHSHGGQVRLPGIGPLVLPELGQRYPMGLRQVQGMNLYTTRGVGMTGLALRINCPPEITLIQLQAA